MTLQELLNTDLDSAGRWIAQGFAWWLHELAELVPPALRTGRRPRSSWSAEMQTMGGPIRLWREDGAEEWLHEPRGAGRSVDLFLPPGAVLVRELNLPRLSPGDLRRLVRVNIDRFTPFRPEQVYFDIAVLAAAEAGAQQRVRLGVLARDRADAMLEAAVAKGLVVARVGVGAEEDDKRLSFDFLPAIRSHAGAAPLARCRTLLWSSCAVLFVANLLLAILMDANDVAQLKQRVEAQQPMVAAATRLRRTVELERAHRMALLTQRAAQEPLRILDAATRALPSDTWVERLEWNGHAVRLVGFKPSTFNVLAALHGPALANARSLVSDMPTTGANGRQSFDVMADAGPKVSP